VRCARCAARTLAAPLPARPPPKSRAAARAGPANKASYAPARLAGAGGDARESA
jgi:hypothetical protein